MSKLHLETTATALAASAAELTAAGDLQAQTLRALEQLPEWHELQHHRREAARAEQLLSRTVAMTEHQATSVDVERLQAQYTAALDAYREARNPTPPQPSEA